MPPKPPRMGGGGANLLDSPENADNSDFEGGNEHSETDEKNEEEYIVTYKTYDDYFTDLNITAETITEADLTGSGSANDPYIVHSTRGFLWLSNQEVCNINMWNKSIELACDVILNDEIFDEKGTPSGGDGVVYSWKPISFWYDAIFNGNNHFISGFYINEPEKQSIALFISHFVEVKNIKLKNFFISALGSVAALCINVEKCYNCENVSGSIVAQSGGKVAGIVISAKAIKNCINRATVRTSSSFTSGILVQMNTQGVVENCDNYGNITGAYKTSGIISNCFQNNKILNCDNYGEINTISSTASGIISRWDSNPTSLVIENCKNYGKISGPSTLGGIIALCEGDVSVVNCESYGKLIGTNEDTSCGGIIGGIANAYSENDSQILIKNCTNKTNEYFIGQINKSAKYVGITTVFVRIEGSKNYYEGDDALSLFSYVGNIDLIEIRNMECSLKTPGVSFYLVNQAYKSNLKVSNMYFRGNSENIRTTKLNRYGAFLNAEMQSCIFNFSNQKCFYGTDFSGFYCDWKTGKIGLKALNGKGFFQGGVTEEWLLAKGFEKKG